MAASAGPGVVSEGHESFVVKDIHCRRCAGTLERTIASLPGVRRAAVDAMIGWTSIDFDDEIVTADELRRAVAAGGYHIIDRWG